LAGSHGDEVSVYKYYLLLAANASPWAVFRGCSSYEYFELSGLERAKKNGVWSGTRDDVDVVLSSWENGYFDPEQDEISEEEAQDYLAKWRAGCWPARD
jgi:hypothetical protein